MLRYLCFCLALVSTAAAHAQQQQASVRVNGGHIVGQFIPDGQPQTGPVPDPKFQQQGATPQWQQQTHQHAGNCSCGSCKRTVVGRTKQVFNKLHTTVFTTENYVTEYPVQSFNESPPACSTPKRNPCNSGGGLLPWNLGFVGCRQQQCGPMRGGNVVQTTRPIAGFGVNLFGCGGSVAITKSNGARYAGDPGYGGLGYSSQPVRPW